MIHAISSQHLHNLKLSNKELLDFVDLFFQYPARVFIRLEDFNSKTKNLRGLAISSLGSHEIRLFLSAIQKAVDVGAPTGGNTTVPTTLEEGVLFVLAHELRHVQQFFMHPAQSTFWKGKYRTRPCEVDARRYVQTNEKDILCFSGVEVAERKQRVSLDMMEEIESIVDIFSNIDDVSDDDIRKELGKSGLNNSMCLEIAKNMLSEMNLVL